MKNLITVAVVLVLGLVAYNYFQTGEFSIMPGGSMSDEAREVNRLRGEFRRAAQEYRQAGRSAGLSGLDTTGDAEQALNAVEGVERDLRKLRGQVKEAEVRREIDELLAEIAKYKNDIQ
ncbi:MAG TPA: hypothetical protein VLT81_01030 [Chondromyces sp.]|nr:hypothetical protein [Chondromyces sp.]